MKILVTGGGGLVGSAVASFYTSRGFSVLAPKSSELNLLDKNRVNDFFRNYTFDLVIHAAARVGGVLGNQRFPATFISENLQIQNNVLDIASRNKVKKLVFIASSCIYPPTAKIPLKEESLFTGKFEASNRWYATAKSAGIMQVEAIKLQYGLDWFSVLPTNIYGIRDNFALESGHVIPSLLRKFAEAVKNNSRFVTIWGTGKPKREFLHVDDLVSAINHLVNSNLQIPEPFMVNIGSNEEVSISELASLLAEISGFNGSIKFDGNFPDGVYQKTLDSQILRSTGWSPTISLVDGLRDTFEWVSQNLESLRKNEIVGVETKLGISL
jgi:GDP-L-fucose synthase